LKREEGAHLPARSATPLVPTLVAVRARVAPVAVVPGPVGVVPVAIERPEAVVARIIVGARIIIVVGRSGCRHEGWGKCSEQYT